MKRRYKILNGILIFFTVSLTSLAIVISYSSDCVPITSLSESEETMNAIVYNCYGSSEVLKLATVDKPQPDADEVLIKVHAASVNPLDWHYMRGSPYIMRLGTGLGSPDDGRMGVDFSGTVKSVGKNVKRFKPGDEVFGGSTGAFSEYVTISENGALTLKPTNMTFQQSATVAIAGITALQALRDQGKIKAGQKVLINGASGGVGTFAVQIAKAFGAEVSGVCSTRNLDMVRSIGADHVFDYTQQDYTESGQLYDIIIDNVGNHSLSKNRQVLKPDGILVMIGGEKGNWLGPLISPIKALIVSPFVEQELQLFIAELNHADLIFLAKLMQDGKLVPVIDRSYSLSEVPIAIQYSEEGHAQGKIVVNLE